MPSIILSVTNAQWERIKAALEITTAAEATAWIKARIKAEVLRNETRQLANQAETDKRAELKAEGW